MIRCNDYKDVLADFAKAFDDLKQELRDRLQVHEVVKLIGIQANVTTILAYVERKNRKEREAAEYVETHGGIESVIRVSCQNRRMIKFSMSDYGPE